MFEWLRRRRRVEEVPPLPPGSPFPAPLFPPPPPAPRIRAATPVVWVPDAEPPRVGLADVGLDRVELCPARRVDVPEALWFTNHAASDPDFARHMRQTVYAARTAQLDAVCLFRLPPDTEVFGGGQYLTGCDGRFLAEQLPPGIGTAFTRIDAMAPLDLPVVEIDGEVLLVARFGVGTWGPWLAELLPKLVLAERAFPGRFSFLLPAPILEAQPAAIWASIRQSLEAYGIGAGRIFAADPGKTYRFGALHAVSPAWSDHVLHPEAGAAMRDAVAAIAPAPYQRLAVVRSRAAGRALANRDDVYEVLRDRGFAMAQTGSWHFTDQVAAFKGARIVFAILGSDLANIIFAPPGVRVIAASPHSFADRFFYGLLLERGGTMADLRGPITEQVQPDFNSTFLLDTAALRSALQGLDG